MRREGNVVAAVERYAALQRNMELQKAVKFMNAKHSRLLATMERKPRRWNMRYERQARNEEAHGGKKEDESGGEEGL